MRLALVAIVGMGALYCGSAAAQTTQCYPNNPSMPEAGTTCHSTGIPALPAARSASVEVYDGRGGSSTRLEAIDNVCGRGDWILRGCTLGQHSAAVSRKKTRDQVMSLLAENHCPEAIKAALSGGDLALAREARAFCTP